MLNLFVLFLQRRSLLLKCQPLSLNFLQQFLPVCWSYCFQIWKLFLHVLEKFRGGWRRRCCCWWWCCCGICCGRSLEGRRNGKLPRNACSSSEFLEFASKIRRLLFICAERGRLENVDKIWRFCTSCNIVLIMTKIYLLIMIKIYFQNSFNERKWIQWFRGCTIIDVVAVASGLWFRYLHSLRT